MQSLAFSDFDSLLCLVQSGNKASPRSADNCDFVSLLYHLLCLFLWIYETYGYSAFSDWALLHWVGRDSGQYNNKSQRLCYWRSPHHAHPLVSFIPIISSRILTLDQGYISNCHRVCRSREHVQIGEIY